LFNKRIQKNVYIDQKRGREKEKEEEEEKVDKKGR
jgi:hypothetical protein